MAAAMMMAYIAWLLATLGGRLYASGCEAPSLPPRPAGWAEEQSFKESLSLSLSLVVVGKLSGRV